MHEKDLDSDGAEPPRASDIGGDPYFHAIASRPLLGREGERLAAGRIVEAEVAFWQAAFSTDSAAVIAIVAGVLCVPVNILETVWTTCPCRFGDVDKDKRAMGAVVKHMAGKDGREAKAVRAAHAAWCRSVNHFVEANLRLVVSIARPYALASGEPIHDLCQEGNLGLLTAAQRFDPDVGTKFSTYATWWIRQNIWRHLQNHRASVRVPVGIQERRGKILRAREALTLALGRPPEISEVCRALSLTEHQYAVALEADNRSHSLDEPVGNGDGKVTGVDMLPDVRPNETLEMRSDALDAKRKIAAALACLTKSERMIISERFQDRTLASLAGEVERKNGDTGMSRERVRQIQERAMRKLRRHFGLDVPEDVVEAPVPAEHEEVVGMPGRVMAAAKRMLKEEGGFTMVRLRASVPDATISQRSRIVKTLVDAGEMVIAGRGVYMKTGKRRG